MGKYMDRAIGAVCGAGLMVVLGSAAYYDQLSSAFRKEAQQAAAYLPEAAHVIKTHGQQNEHGWEFQGGNILFQYYPDSNVIEVRTAHRDGDLVHMITTTIHDYGKDGGIDLAIRREGVDMGPIIIFNNERVVKSMSEWVKCQEMYTEALRQLVYSRGKLDEQVPRHAGRGLSV